MGERMEMLIALEEAPRTILIYDNLMWTASMPRKMQEWFAGPEDKKRENARKECCTIMTSYLMRRVSLAKRDSPGKSSKKPEVPVRKMPPSTCAGKG